jgi:hypothetical protein
MGTTVASNCSFAPSHRLLLSPTLLARVSADCGTLYRQFDWSLLPARVKTQSPVPVVKGIVPLEPGLDKDGINSLQKENESHAKNSATWLIVAKERPLWARKRQNISRLPLHRSTWCLVINPRTNASRFELLTTCQKKSIAGTATYRDIDCGLGIHPVVDQKWMRHLVDQQTQLTSADYRLWGVASRSMGQRDNITVQLEVLNSDMKSVLMTMGKDAGHENSSPVRWSFSAFTSVGGDKESVLRTLEHTEEGRLILERRKQRLTANRRRERCKRKVRRTGVSMCERNALRGSKNVYTLQKSRILSAERMHACCGRCSY